MTKPLGRVLASRSPMSADGLKGSDGYIAMGER